MFENKPKPIDGPGTIVGANVKLAGTLKDVNDIIVHGQIEGEVISEKNVSVEQTAMVKGPIKAKNVLVSGKVIGEIEAYESLELSITGNVSGSIATKKLSIKPGAVLNGKCKMTGESATGEKETKKEDIKETPKKDDNKEDTKESKDAKKPSHDLFKHVQNEKYELE